MNRIIFVGECRIGKPTINGVAAKNYFLLRRLQGFFDVTIVDTDGWKRKPWVLVRLLWNVLFHRSVPLTISLNTPSAYKFISLVNLLVPQRHLCYFVIGGILPQFMKKKGIQKNRYCCVNWFMVESFRMKFDMEELGFTNVIRLPNFKDINYMPPLNKRTSSQMKFVFLSRIIPEKGCDDILNVMQEIGKRQELRDITVDFYGVIDSEYRHSFLDRVSQTPNVSFRGFIDLRQTQNYDILASYDAMLFPTYWHGEGFPGIVIDAFIAGLPIIASDWGHNKEIIEDGKTGILIPPHDVAALTEQMIWMRDNISKCNEMSVKCRETAMKYSTQNVLSDNLIKQIYENHI